MPDPLVGWASPPPGDPASLFSPVVRGRGLLQAGQMISPGVNSLRQPGPMQIMTDR